MIKAIRAVNFDLDTNQMALLLGSKTVGYSKLKKSFKKVGFIHRQGSGYLSKKPISKFKAIQAIKIVARQNPWLLSCLNKMDVTVVDEFFDVVPLVRAEIQKQSQKSKRSQKANAQSAVSHGSGKTAHRPTVTSLNASNISNTTTTRKFIPQKRIGKENGLTL